MPLAASVALPGVCDGARFRLLRLRATSSEIAGAARPLRFARGSVGPLPGPRPLLWGTSGTTSSVWTPVPLASLAGDVFPDCWRARPLRFARGSVAFAGSTAVALGDVGDDLLRLDAGAACFARGRRLPRLLAHPTASLCARFPSLRFPSSRRGSFSKEHGAPSRRRTPRDRSKNVLSLPQGRATVTVLRGAVGCPAGRKLSSTVEPLA